MSKTNRSIDTSLKRLQHRNGLFINNIWAHHLVDNNDTVPVSDILESLKSELVFSQTEKEKYIEEVTIPTAIMREINILIHKSLVTGRSFTRDLNSGQHTYAEISAYNGCLFFARSILLLLGLWISPKKFNESFWLIDLYPRKEKKIDSYFNFIKIGNSQPGHIEIWLILKRILNTSKNLPFDTEFISFINDIEEVSIGFKRHNLQYFNDYWINEQDLKTDSISINDLSWIKDFNKDIYAKLDLREKSSDNSIVYFYFILARNCYVLLTTISKVLPSSFKSNFDELIDNFNVLKIMSEKGWLEYKDFEQF